MRPDEAIFAFFLTGLVLTIGWLIWAYLRKQRRKSSQPPSWLDRQDSKFAEVDGFRIHYLKMGKGKPLVLLHGIGASLFIWRFVLSALSRDFMVVAIDLPGFGESSKPANRDYGLDAQAERIETLLTQIGIQSASLVGSSMGGAIALWMAKKYPTRFREVIAISPAVFPSLLPIPLGWIRLLSTRTGLTVTPTIIQHFLKRVVSRHELITGEVVAAYWKPFVSPDALPALFSATELLRDSRLPSSLVQLDCRCLILWGSRDRVIPVRYLKKLSSILPNAKFETHPRAGHHPMEDEPDWILSEIHRFFDVNP